MSLYDETFAMLDRLNTVELAGSVSEVRGLTLLVKDLSLPVGSMIRIQSQCGSVRGEVVGFDREQTVVMLYGATEGICRGDRVVGAQTSALVGVGEELLGRVVNGLGEPIDGKGPLRELVVRPLAPRPLDPLGRKPIDEPLGTGVRALDAMLPVGRGQRLGIFSGPGVGKSTLLGMISRNSDAHVSVIGLIGERGREVRDFIEQTLGPQGLARAVVVVATGDESALLRTRAALYATSIAEYFRDEGLNVTLVMDSVTRFCQAQRQIGLAAGEPPATKGYTPSVFANLPLLLERSGRTVRGSITGFYTILVEGDDINEPISDASRGILDGHIVLSRDLGNKGHWPAIDVASSVSRVAVDVIDAEHQAARVDVLRLISSWAEVADLVNIGAYARGARPEYDLAIDFKDAVDGLLRQSVAENVTFPQARQAVIALAESCRREAARRLRQPGAARPQAQAGTR